MKTWNEVVEGYRERWIEIFSQGVEGFSKQACREIVYALTSKTEKWIRIEDQKPGADHVLVTAKWKEDDYEVFELDYGVTKYEAERGNEWCKRVIDHVIAWMPMPKPYREGK